MFQVIEKKRGSGTSKGLIKFANDTVNIIKGNIVFLDDSDRNQCELHHNIRFINYKEYNIKTKEEFFGFILGVCAQNYDIRELIIDGASTILKNANETKEIEKYFRTNLDYIRVKIAISK